MFQVPNNWLLYKKFYSDLSFRNGDISLIVNLLQVVTGPMEKDVQRAAADIIEYSKKTGWQAGNFGIDDKKPWSSHII